MSPKLSLDFGKAGMVIPNGTYRFIVEKAMIGLSKAKDSYNINMQCKAIDMPEGMDDFEGKTVWHLLNTQPASADFTQRALEAVTQKPWREDDMDIGLTEEEVEQVDKGEKVEVEMLKDLTFIAFGKQEEYEGTTSLKLKKFWADDSDAPEIGAANIEE